MRAIWACWLRRRAVAVPRRVLHAHADDAVLQPAARDLDGIGVPKVFLAGVGELMTEVAGEVCDGFLCHPFTTERYLREVTLPALRARAREVGRIDRRASRSPRRCSSSPAPTSSGARRVADGCSAADRVLRLDPGVPSGARRCTAGAISGRAQPAVEGRASGSRWASRIDDELLATFAVVGEPSDDRRRAAPALRRCRRSAQLYPFAGNADDPAWQQIADDLNHREADDAHGRGRDARRGSPRGTWPAAACPTTSSGACRASRASRRAAGGRRPRACGGGSRDARRRGSSVRTSATTTTLSLPLYPSMPKAMTLPARTPSSTPTARSMSSGKTLRPPTMITSLIRPHSTS